MLAGLGVLGAGWDRPPPGCSAHPPSARRSIEESDVEKRRDPEADSGPLGLLRSLTFPLGRCGAGSRVNILLQYTRDVGKVAGFKNKNTGQSVKLNFRNNN